ncbi:MAG: energy transducer TonB [Thioalkalivibrio sp.]|nr:MAG: energy transducer TonB [Thioalkalivibrio sp.]
MSATLPQPEPDDGGRLGLTLFLALILHALVILGVGFEMFPGERPEQVTLDVTWVDAPSPEPEDARHIAAEAQAASGEAEESQVARSPEPSMDEAAPAEPLEAPPAAVDASPPADPEPVATPEPAQEPAPRDPAPAEIADAPGTPSAATIVARGRETARAMPHETRQELRSRASRTLYLDTLSARAAPEAAYLETWIRKVERVGNLNYPDEARRRGLSGSLVLSVRLDPEGRVQDIAIAQSSGEPVLDQAASRIVELAAPFAPFTDDMREQYDHLVITRTWAFRRDRVERAR